MYYTRGQSPKEEALPFYSPQKLTYLGLKPTVGLGTPKTLTTSYEGYINITRKLWRMPRKLIMQLSTSSTLLWFGGGDDVEILKEVLWLLTLLIVSIENLRSNSTPKILRIRQKQSFVDYLTKMASKPTWRTSLKYSWKSLTTPTKKLSLPS